MNTYIATHVRTAGRGIQGGEFKFQAADSDAASAELQRLHSDAMYPAAKYTMFLCTGEPVQTQPIGDYTCTGFDYPAFFDEVQEKYGTIKGAAQRDYRVVRSRGAHLYAVQNGEHVVSEGDCIALPHSATELRQRIMSIREAFPECTCIGVCLAVNGANTVTQMNEGEYDPYVGEANIVIWERK